MGLPIYISTIDSVRSRPEIRTHIDQSGTVSFPEHGVASFLGSYFLFKKAPPDIPARPRLRQRYCAVA